MATRGLAATKPGTALGGRSRSQMNNNLTTQPNEMITERERSMDIISHVHVPINETPSNVSSMPDFDILYDELCGSPGVEDKSVGDVLSQLEKEEEEKNGMKKKASIVKLFSTTTASGGKDKGGSSIKPKAIYDKNKSLTTTTTKTKNSSTLNETTSVRFTSDAANNYYQAMKFGKTKLVNKSNKSSTVSPTNDKGVSDYLNLLRDKKKNNKTRDEIINECLSNSKTPAEISEYILNECGEQIDKMELYTIILTKQRERQAKHAANARKLQEERERAVLQEEERSNSIIETGGKQLLAQPPMKNNKGPPATLKLQTRSEQLLESVKQAHEAAQAQQQPSTVPSSTSMLSDLSPRSVFSAAGACSIATEYNYVPSGLSPSDNGLSPANDNIIIDTKQQSVKQLKQRYEPNNEESFDPPISEYPSPGTDIIGSPTTDYDKELGYPDDDDEDDGTSASMRKMMNPSVMALLEKVGLPESLSPKSPNKSSKTMSPGAQEYAKNGIELIYNEVSSSSNNTPTTKAPADFTLPLSPPPARRSPTGSSTSSGGSGGGSSSGKKIRSASPIVLANKLKNKISSKGGGGLLPPRIPTRPIVPVDPPSESEGQIAKSVTIVDVTNAIVEEEEEDDDETRVQSLPTDPDGVSVMNTISSSSDGIVDDDTSVEVTSFFDHTTQGDDRDELKLLSTVAAKIDSPPQSRLALARQKLSRGGSKKKFSVDGSAASSAGTTTASINNTKTSSVNNNNNNDSSTVTSTTSSKSRLRKKEKMKKIMEYRKRASPSLKLDGWKGLAENKKREEEMSRMELLELLKKEREAANAAAAAAEASGGEDGSKSSSLPDDIKHPVKQVNVYPNASEYDDNEDMTMPPELQESKKVDIWTEKNVGESFDQEGGVTMNKKTDLAQAFMSCGERILDGDTMYDENTLADDVTDTVADNKTNNPKEGDTRADSPASGETSKRNRFACGIDPEDLGLDSKIGRDLAYEAKEVVRDLKSGVKKSIRSIFGACDITQEGGIDFISKNVDTTKDQLLGKVPLSPKKRTSSTSRSSTASSSPENAPSENHTGGTTQQEGTPTATATMKAATDNPQAEKITEILDGNNAARKHFENVYTSSNQEEEIEQSAELHELMKKEKMSEKEKRELYMKKLKSVSL